MNMTVTNNTVSDLFESFTVTPLAETTKVPAIDPTKVFVAPPPKPVIAAATPVQTHEVTVIDTATILTTLKALATLGALWILGSALIALATLFLNIVMPIIFGLLVLAVLSVALKNTRAGDLLQQLFCQNKQPAPQKPPVRVENGDS